MYLSEKYCFRKNLRILKSTKKDSSDICTLSALIFLYCDSKCRFNKHFQFLKNECCKIDALAFSALLSLILSKQSTLFICNTTFSRVLLNQLSYLLSNKQGSSHQSIHEKLLDRIQFFSSATKPIDGKEMECMFFRFFDVIERDSIASQFQPMNESLNTPPQTNSLARASCMIWAKELRSLLASASKRAYEEALGIEPKTYEEYSDEEESYSSWKDLFESAISVETDRVKKEALINHFRKKLATDHDSTARMVNLTILSAACSAAGLPL